MYQYRAGLSLPGTRLVCLAQPPSQVLIFEGCRFAQSKGPPLLVEIPAVGILRRGREVLTHATPNLPTSIVDFRGFDSSTILNLRGEIPRPIGDFPDSLSQAMLVGILLVWRLGVCRAMHTPRASKDRGVNQADLLHLL